MATRFYFQAGTTPPVSPAFAAGWNSTTGMVRLKMDTSKVATAFTDYPSSSNPFGGSYSGVAQFVSRPLNGAQTITATGLRPIVARVRNNSGLSDKEVAFVLRVCNQAGTAFRGTLLAQTFSNGADFSGSYTSRVPAQDNMTSVAAQDGDRLVLEIGFRNNTSGAGNNSYELGDSASSDLGTAAGETNQYNPWCELVSVTLSFQVEGGTDYTKTISNSIRTFGLGASTKWGATYSMVWGTSKWGEGTIDLQTDVAKYISNSYSVAETLSTETAFIKSFSYQLTLGFEGTEETLQDAAGYYILFPGDVRDGDERTSATYTEQSNASTSWASGTVAATTWSE